MTNLATSAGNDIPPTSTSHMDRLRGGLAPIADKAVFCTWRLETSGDSKGKPRKVPYVRGGLRLAGRYDNPELQFKLMTLEAAIAACQLGHYSGVGIVFFPGCGVIGVDIDHCLDTNRELTPTLAQRKALALLKKAAFMERSQSDTGVHAIVLGDAQTVKANGELEVFGNKNFLALTGYGGKGVATQIDFCRIEKIIALVAEIKERAVSDSAALALKGYGVGSVDVTGVSAFHRVPDEGSEPVGRVESALRYINPDIDRDTWLKIIFAIRHGLGDRPEAFELANIWSKGGLCAAK